MGRREKRLKGYRKRRRNFNVNKLYTVGIDPYRGEVYTIGSYVATFFDTSTVYNYSYKNK